LIFKTKGYGSWFSQSGLSCLSRQGWYLMEQMVVFCLMVPRA